MWFNAISYVVASVADGAADGVAVVSAGLSSCATRLRFARSAAMRLAASVSRRVLVTGWGWLQAVQSW